MIHTRRISHQSWVDDGTQIFLNKSLFNRAVCTWLYFTHSTLHSSVGQNSPSSWGWWHFLILINITDLSLSSYLLNHWRNFIAEYLYLDFFPCFLLLYFPMKHIYSSVNNFLWDLVNKSWFFFWYIDFFGSHGMLLLPFGCLETTFCSPSTPSNYRSNIRKPKSGYEVENGGTNKSLEQRDIRVQSDI